MPIRRELPTATTTRPSMLAPAIGAYLQAARAAEGERAHAGDTPIRHSWAGRCARAVAYDLAGEAPSDPLSSESLWTFAMGHRAHEIVQSALADCFGANCTLEVAKVVNEYRSCHLDFLVRFPEPRPMTIDGVTHEVSSVAGEIKSTGGFSWKMCVEREGPKADAYLQGCLNAQAVDADMLVLIYVALDRQNTAAAKLFGDTRTDLDAVVAEWWYPREVYVPDAEREAARLERVAAYVAEGRGAEVTRRSPDMPRGAVVVDPQPPNLPDKGMWVIHDPVTGDVDDSGTTWRCGYCPHRATCKTDLLAEQTAASTAA